MLLLLVGGGGDNGSVWYVNGFYVLEKKREKESSRASTWKAEKVQGWFFLIFNF